MIKCALKLCLLKDYYNGISKIIDAIRLSLIDSYKRVYELTRREKLKTIKIVRAVNELRGLRTPIIPIRRPSYE